MEVADQTELLEAIDESDGSVLWKLPSEFSDPTNGAGNSALTIRGSTLFDYSYLRGAIEARNVKTGALLWRAGNFTDSVGAGSPDLASLTTDGQSVWLATRRWTDIKDPTSSINTLHKFTDGKEVWSTDLPDTYKAQTPGGAALANGVYYLTVPPSSAPGTLQVVSLAFDADSGQILWTNVVPGTAVQDPPEVAEGHLLQAGYGLRAFSIK
jgi:outer membrane protein assembly factor BamB